MAYPYRITILSVFRSSALLVASLLSTVKADDFLLLSGDRTAYDARIELIDSAQSEIDAAYYAVDSGDVAYSILNRFRLAAQRGVKVRLLLDGLMARLPSEVTDILLHDGVEIRVYHPPESGRPLWLNRRLHYKLLVVDRQSMILGSRNLEDAHFGLEEENFVDMEALLTGEVSHRVARHFCQLWNSDDVVPVSGSRGCSFGDKHKYYAKRLRQAAACLDQRVDFIDLPNPIGIEPIVESLCRVQIIHDQASDKRERKFQQQVISMIDSAKETLWIESPYPVLERKVKDALYRALNRGVKVSLLTNSIGSTDRPIVYAAYQNDKREYQRRGITLIEYTGRGTLHSKAILVDDQSVFIGSYNMDVRSDRLNLEFGVWIEDARVCQVIKQELLGRKLSSEFAQRRWLLAPEAVRGDASPWKLFHMRFGRALAPMIRGYL